MKTSNKNCIYCSSASTQDNRITKDHIPPKVFLKGIDIREERITVPCCNKCNQFFSKYEEKTAEIFQRLRCDNYDLDFINEIRNNTDLSLIISKIALGYKYLWTDQYVFNDTIKGVEFLFKGFDDSKLIEFEQIELSEISPEIVTKSDMHYIIETNNDNNSQSSFCYFMQDKTNIFNSHFWCFFDRSNNSIRFSFFGRLFIIVFFE